MIQIKKIKESEEFIIDFKQLKESFPEIAREYEKVYKKWGKRPKINVYSEETYSFSAEEDDPLTDYWVNKTTIFFKDRETIVFNSRFPDPRLKEGKYKLGFGDAILECRYINYYGAKLIIAPSMINALLTSDNKELDIIQKYVLGLYSKYISSARYKYFYSPSFFTWKGKTVLTLSNIDIPIDEKEYISELKKYGSTYKVAWESVLLSLQSKGFIRIDKGGKSQLTMDGKNAAISVDKEFSKKENSTNNKNKITESSGYYDPEFGGSENFYKAGFGKMLYTDSVKYFAEKRKHIGQ
jgi:hypothetical protein